MDLPVFGLGRGPRRNSQHASRLRRQHRGDHLVRAQGIAHRGPGRVHVPIQKMLLDDHQQVTGRDTEENVRLPPMLELMEDRPLSERALHVPEGIFH